MRKDPDKFLQKPLKGICKFDFNLKRNVNFLISADPRL